MKIEREMFKILLNTALSRFTFHMSPIDRFKKKKKKNGQRGKMTEKL